MSDDKGGSAFPWSREYEVDKGMTLRDWFAGQALSGLMAAHTADGDWTAMGAEDYAASTAYKAADAMLKERSK